MLTPEQAREFERIDSKWAARARYVTRHEEQVALESEARRLAPLRDAFAFAAGEDELTDQDETDDGIVCLSGCSSLCQCDGGWS